MCKNSLTRKKKFILIGVTAFGLLFFQASLKATLGDKNDCVDSSMLSEKTGSNFNYCSSVFYQEAQEKEPEIEYWMLNPYDSFWQGQEIALEIWMYDIHCMFWQEILVNEKEEYEIEDWMINPAGWTTKAEIIAGIITD